MSSSLTDPVPSLHNLSIPDRVRPVPHLPSLHFPHLVYNHEQDLVYDHQQVPPEPHYCLCAEPLLLEPLLPSLDGGMPLEIYAKSHNGTMPVRLYIKKLEESDLNRFVITQKGKLVQFLTPEENKAMLESQQGLEFYAIDNQAFLYTLRFKLWPNNTNEIVIDCDAWNRMIIENDVEKGDWVQVWAYRVQERQLRLAFTFH